ncbi:MAG: hypothetical protein DRP63_04160 [Planctomycetota bacterium]|nr:MAG: hypothetical protein DRP63_04160 [Planctomycetota bacterium]
MIPVEDGQYNERLPFVTYGIVAANAIFFFGALFSSDYAAAVKSLSVSRQNLCLGRLFSSMFTHAGWFHLVSNMFFLGFFGRNTERLLTPLPYVLLYLLSGILGAVAQTNFTENAETPLVGASACVYGVMAAYMVLFPKQRIKAFYLFAPHPSCSGYFTVPAYIYVLLFFVTQDVLMLIALGNLSQVGHVAHLTGFCFGAGFALVTRAVSHRHKKAWRSQAQTHSFVSEPEPETLAFAQPERVRRAEVVKAAGGKGQFWIVLKKEQLNEAALKTVEAKSAIPLSRKYFVAKNLNATSADRLLLLLLSHNIPAVVVEAIHIPATIPVEMVIGVAKHQNRLVLIDQTQQRWTITPKNVVFLSAAKIEYHHHIEGSRVTDRIVSSLSIDVVCRNPFCTFRIVRHPTKGIDIRTQQVMRVISNWAYGLKGVEQLVRLITGESPRIFHSFSEYDEYLLWRLVLAEIVGHK